MESQNSPEDNHFTFYSFCTRNRQSPYICSTVPVVCFIVFYFTSLLHEGNNFLRPVGHRVGRNDIQTGFGQYFLAHIHVRSFQTND